MSQQADQDLEVLWSPVYGSKGYPGNPGPSTWEQFGLGQEAAVEEPPPPNNTTKWLIWGLVGAAVVGGIWYVAAQDRKKARKQEGSLGRVKREIASLEKKIAKEKDPTKRKNLKFALKIEESNYRLYQDTDAWYAKSDAWEKKHPQKPGEDDEDYGFRKEKALPFPKGSDKKYDV